MSKSERYLKMKTPSDLLTVRFFASSGQLKGQFLQESDPPWTIWWEVPGEQSLIGRLGNMLQTQLEAPEKIWEEGTPGSKLREMSWLDLFRKAVIKKEPARKVSEEVILMTADREIFYAAVKKHFMLQQGECEFAIFNAKHDYYLLKITNPSLWVFNTLAQEEFTWFNMLSGHSGVYVEAGWRIHDISGPDCFNQFKVLDGILLIQKDGRLLNLKPSWKKGESIIKIEIGKVDLPQKTSSENLIIRPGLRDTDRHQLPVFWKITDRERLKAIISNESLKNFRSYTSWFCEDGRIFILAHTKKADRALATILSDAFTAFTEVEERIMVPMGQLLTPRLSSERLHGFLEAETSDYICFEQIDDQLQCTLLKASSMLPMEDFVSLEINQAAARAEALQPSWKFNFKELKKKKQLVEVETRTAVYEKLHAASEENQVGEVSGSMSAAKKRQHRVLNLENLPEISSSENASLRLQLEELDRQLNSNATRSDLWRQRSEITRKMRMKLSTLASAMNAAVLDNNTELLVDYIFEYCRQTPALSHGLENSITEIEKGRLLAEIRSSAINSEFHYLLLLTFAARFNDRDIFNQAVEGMKKAFSGEARQFYNFNETRVASGGGINVENRVELLSESDLPRINMNVRKFLLQVGCCSDYGAINTTKLQLFKLLSVHLSEKTAQSLLGPISITPEQNNPYPYQRNYIPGGSDLPQYFTTLIRRWPASASMEDLPPAILRWLRLLSMEKIKETPLRDFFTGELYKPPFMFSRKEENAHNYGVAKISWIKELDQESFPEISDGKPLARSIYQRFGEGKSDWSDFFSLALKSADVKALAKAQRLLLIMVSEFGPHPDFEQFIMPALIATNANSPSWDIYNLTMYCDMYRLCLAYRKPVDEQRLFNLLINRIPQPPRGWEDFRDSAEWIIMCLLLTSSPIRRFQLDNLTDRAMRWLQEAIKTRDQDIFAETLTILNFLGIGILADLVPEKLEIHQLLEKRRVFWIQHAFALASRGEKGFKDWQSACGT
ncbi:MAG: hypothetical protein EOM80_07910 [Erysipelotrichia bacterium]|nr:hypothetical protein [Erysipelotrichia bacterium]